MNAILPRKEPDVNHIKLVDEMAGRMKEVIKDPNNSTASKNGKTNYITKYIKIFLHYLVYG